MENKISILSLAKKTNKTEKWTQVYLQVYLQVYPSPPKSTQIIQVYPRSTQVQATHDQIATRATTKEKVDPELRRGKLRYTRG